MAKMPEIFNKYQPHIEQELKSLFEGRDLRLYNMMKYHMGWIDSQGETSRNGNNGKMLRATLCLLASESMSGDFKKALPVSAAIELIHNYSLVHDDIQDDDEMRRHRPTVWKIWGKPQAINAGSALKILANLSVLKLNDLGVPREKQVEIFDILDTSCLEMIEGQYMDIDFESRDIISVEEYLKMIEKKTSALISGALKVGAALHLDNGKLEAFEKFGKYLGIAFQITDDILGIWGNDTKTGKPQGNDIRKRKKSLPIVLCLQESDDKGKKQLLKIYRKNKVSNRGVAVVLKNLEEIGARYFCQRQAKKYYEMAISEIERLPIKGKFPADYRQLSEFLIKRDF
jgi:geranylgeranyl diphosphate synthase type I